MEAERMGAPGQQGLGGLRRGHQACRCGDPPRCPSRRPSGGGRLSLCSLALGAAGGFVCTWVGHCVLVILGR